MGPYKKERSYDAPADRNIQEYVDFYCSHCYGRFDMVL